LRDRRFVDSTALSRCCAEAPACSITRTAFSNPASRLRSSVRQGRQKAISFLDRGAGLTLGGAKRFVGKFQFSRIRLALISSQL
jgi:hypothetical protein